MNLFHSIVNKYKDAKQKKLNKQEFRKALLKAVEDGKLTTDEISELDKKKAEFVLTDEDIRQIRAEVFTTAFTAASQTNK